MIYSVPGVVSSLAAATPKTAWRYNASASRRGKLSRFLSFDQSVTGTDQPIVCQVWSTSGTDGTGTTVTPVAPYSGPILGTNKVNYTVEPTVGTPVLLSSFEIPTASGVDIDFTFPSNLDLSCPVSGNISIVFTSAQARALPMYFTVFVEE